MKKITYIILLLLTFNFGFGQIVAWEMDPVSGSNTGDEVTVNATTLAANLNTSTLSRGSGIDSSALGRSFSSDDFTNGGTQASAITNNDYLQFQVSATSGYQVSLSSLDVNFRRSSTGPVSFIWRYSTDGVSFTDIGTVISYTATTPDGNAQAQINLSTIPALQNVVSGTTITIRLYGWGATAANGTFAIGRLTGNDLSIGGTVTVAPPCATSTTYTALSGWSNGLPNSLSKAVIINDNYDTSAGNIIACSLTVDTNATLTIINDTYVEVQNNLTVDGSIIVNPYGDFVQIDDSAIVNGAVLTTPSKITVEKKTSPLNAWYEYTYWSSPVSGETIGGG